MKGLPLVSPAGQSLACRDSLHWRRPPAGLGIHSLNDPFLSWSPPLCTYRPGSASGPQTLLVQLG